MATSPVLTNSLVGLFGNVHGGSFTEAEIQTVPLTDAVTNACTWAVAFHTALAPKEGLDPDVQALRDRRVPNDNKLAALSALARTMIEKPGRLDDEDVDRFIAAGFGKDHALEIIAIVAASTITNYAAKLENAGVAVKREPASVAAIISTSTLFSGSNPFWPFAPGHHVLRLPAFRRPDRLPCPGGPDGACRVARADGGAVGREEPELQRDSARKPRAIQHLT